VETKDSDVTLESEFVQGSRAPRVPSAMFSSDCPSVVRLEYCVMCGKLFPEGRQWTLDFQFG
jgi:hypothetical protein